jgi:UDP-N-acetylmuramyl pentapeptide phosphotransferase/UDP-N-acetylglucosamine-1-phosphate transferase
MGDVGSTVLGASVAIALLNAPTPHHFWTASTVILPLTGDAFYTLIRRLMRRENIFRAHRTHLYQRLQQSGWSHSHVAIAYLLLTGAIAFFVPVLNTMSLFCGSLLTIGAVICAEVYLHDYHRRNSSVNE